MRHLLFLCCISTAYFAISSCKSTQKQSTALKDGNAVKIVDGKFHRLVFGKKDGKITALICSNGVSVRFISLEDCKDPYVYKEPLSESEYLKNLKTHLGLDKNSDQLKSELEDIQEQMKELAKAQVDENIAARAEESLLGTTELASAFLPLIAEMRIQEEELQFKIVKTVQAESIYSKVTEALKETSKVNVYASVQFLSPEKYILASFSTETDLPKMTQVRQSFVDDLKNGYYVSSVNNYNRRVTPRRLKDIEDSYKSADRFPTYCPMIVEVRERSVVAIRMLGACSGRVHYLVCEDRTCSTNGITLVFDQASLVNVNGVVFNKQADFRTTKSDESSFRWEQKFLSRGINSQGGTCSATVDPRHDAKGRLISVTVTPFDQGNCGDYLPANQSLSCNSGVFSCENRDFLLVFTGTNSYETISIQKDRAFVVEWVGNGQGGYRHQNAYEILLK